MTEQDLAVKGMASRVIISPAYDDKALSLDFLASGHPHPCPYLPGKIADSEFFFTERLPAELYHDFMDHGFRRSGDFFYRPQCPNCCECKPLRVRVEDFTPSKSQRRVIKRNKDVTVSISSPQFTTAKADMYNAYLRFQHNSDDPSSYEEVKDFLYNSPVKTIELLYFAGADLAAVSVADICSRSFSSVYVFFDPRFSRRSLGVFAALYEIALCREHSIPHYYLGYYVAQCLAMNYKAAFRPCEVMDYNGSWSIK